MEILIFTLNAIVIYLLSDHIVRALERHRDGPLKYRRAVFFLIFLALAIVTFQLLQRIFTGP